MKPYCTKNNGDCSTCSLVNYGRDCQNNSLHGGYRPNSGRKKILPDGAKVKSITCTPAEYNLLKAYLKQIRSVGK